MCAQLGEEGHSYLNQLIYPSIQSSTSLFNQSHRTLTVKVCATQLTSCSAISYSAITPQKKGDARTLASSVSAEQISESACARTCVCMYVCVCVCDGARLHTQQ